MTKGSRVEMASVPIEHRVWSILQVNWMGCPLDVSGDTSLDDLDAEDWDEILIDVKDEFGVDLEFAEILDVSDVKELTAMIKQRMED